VQIETRVRRFTHQKKWVASVTGKTGDRASLRGIFIGA
jgi:hypothetical protein